MTYNKKPLISLIAAISKENNVIGTSDGRIPWHIKEDFQYFKNVTMGHPIIMGRKTFETFKKPLPGRTHIIISRQKNNIKEKINDVDIIWVKDIEEALYEGKKLDNEEIFVIGGGEIYNQFIDYADKLYLTIVEGSYEGEIFFPNYESKGFKKVSSKKSSEVDYVYEFVVLKK